MTLLLDISERNADLINIQLDVVVQLLHTNTAYFKILHYQWNNSKRNVCLQTGWAANQVSHLALIPDIAHSEEESDELNIIR